MTTALVHSRAQLGLSAPAVSVEVHLPTGLPGFTTTGVNGAELRDRVKSAILNSAFEFPKGRIVVNLGPAELPKSGGRYDLAIAVGILIASEQLPAKAFAGYELLGELSLFGDLRAVRGALTCARETAGARRALICPAANNDEFASNSNFQVQLIRHLDDLVNVRQLPVPTRNPCTSESRDPDPLRHVIGQTQAKRALTIAAAGGHHMLMTGPPGAGKTMLAERLRGLLPRLSEPAQSEVAEIYSLGGLTPPASGTPPFRAPHHSASAAAITGGGSPPVPGEITHAHNGVLFLDEMPEFRRDALEALREPLEAGHIRISRRGLAIEYPARFQLVAAMNPCPAGLVCKPANCRCAPEQAERYRNRISAPILDRIDLHIDVAAVPVHALLANQHTNRQTPTPSARREDYVQIIDQARALQLRRNGQLNAHLSQAETERLCRCEPAVEKLLVAAAEKLELTARGYYRALRVARTITDMAQASEADPKSQEEQEVIESGGVITRAAVEEALGYRRLSPR